MGQDHQFYQKLKISEKLFGRFRVNESLRMPVLYELVQKY